MITPADVGLECEAEAVRVWRSPRALSRKRVFHSSPAIRYRHIYECKSFSVSPIKKFLHFHCQILYFLFHTAAFKSLLCYSTLICTIYSHTIIPADWNILHTSIIHHPTPQPSWNDCTQQNFIWHGACQII